MDYFKVETVKIPLPAIRTNMACISHKHVSCLIIRLCLLRCPCLFALLFFSFLSCFPHRNPYIRIRDMIGGRK